ncbi:hypothetical protein PPERSA_04470 [Pseudocohnilembus persalinus]|uniref:Potassium channel domain-containing protein n=1 Tax=Pseudocohnilembus persalinus TaxID=266149 RepID=A0A0V0QQU7_PSEPJ|nr:hypothetical protein PPERSA_04470 [Pseudocohnilembus persalinus]|eukprot:KRX04655.1 hypothetical protein PPERSA_04470 [Pseudocohnilembus persalinus]
MNVIDFLTSLKAMSIVFVIIVIVNIFTAVLIYYAEGNLIKQDNVERSQIQTIPDAMWWSVLTMTTIGYGDKVPHSIFGKIIACFTAFMGITVIAMPVAILGTNFSQTYENQQEQEQITEIKEDCLEEHRQNQNIETVDQMNQDEKNRIFMNTRLLLLYDNNQELFELLNSSNQMYEVVSQNIQTLYEALGDHFDLNLDKTKGKLTVKEMQKKKDQEKKKLKATKLFLNKNQNNHNESINQNNTQNQSNIIQFLKNNNEGSTNRLILQVNNNNIQNNNVQKNQQSNNSRNDENLIFSNQMEKALKQNPQNQQLDIKQPNQDINQQNDNILEKIQEEESQKFGSMVNSIQTPIFDLKKSLITQNITINNTKTEQNKQNENLVFNFDQQNNQNNLQQNNTATFRNLKKNQSQEIQLINELKSKNFSASPTKSNNFLVFSGQNSDDQSWYTSQVKSGLTTQHRQQNSHNSQQTEIKYNQSQNQNQGILQKQMQNYNLQNFGVEQNSNGSKNTNKNNNPYQKEKYQQQFFPQSDMKQMSLKKLNSEGNVYNSQTSMQFHDGFYQQLGSPYSNKNKNNKNNSHNQFSSSTSIFFQKNQQKVGANNIKFANCRNESESSRNIEEKFIQKNKKISEDIKEDLNSQSQLLKYEQQEKQIQEQNEMINNLSVYDILNFLNNKNLDQKQQEQNQTQNKSQDKNLFKEQNKEQQTISSYQNMSLKELLQQIQQKDSKTKQKLE